MNITLISVNDKNLSFRKGENLGIKALETILISNGHNVYIYDLTMAPIDDVALVSNIKENQSSVVGFSISFTHQIHETIRIADLIKKTLPDTHFTLGGQGVSFLLEKVLQDNPTFDTGICFEGEFVMLDLVKHLEYGLNLSGLLGLYYRNNDGIIVFNGYREPIENLDILPFAIQHKRSRVLGQNHISIVSSRGCYGKCSFCASGYAANLFHKSKKWRFRSAENLVQEITLIAKDFGEFAISFVDDNFLGGCPEGYERAKKFAELILENNLSIKWAIECRVDDIGYDLLYLLKKAGLRNVFIGLESGNEKDLKLFNKQISLSQANEAICILNRLNLTYNVGFIMFHPTSTMESVTLNVEFLRENGCANSETLLNTLTLYQGSPIVNHYKRKDLIWYDGYSIKYKFESDLIYTIVQNARRRLVRFFDFETALDKILFNIQNSGDLICNKNYVTVLKLKRKLSDFQADIFTNICIAVKEDRIHQLAISDAEISRFIESFSLKINKLKEEVLC